MSIELLLIVLRDLSWSVYSGTYLVFAVYLSFLSKEKRNLEVRSLMNTGVVLGLSLGLLIFVVLLNRWLAIGHYYPTSISETLAFTLAGALWVSNIVFEIWTLDPIRKIHQEVLLNRINAHRSFQRCHRHLLFHAALIVATHIAFLWLG